MIGLAFFIKSPKCGVILTQESVREVEVRQHEPLKLLALGNVFGPLPLHLP